MIFINSLNLRLRAAKVIAAIINAPNMTKKSKKLNIAIFSIDFSRFAAASGCIFCVLREKDAESIETK